MRARFNLSRFSSVLLSLFSSRRLGRLRLRSRRGHRLPPPPPPPRRPLHAGSSLPLAPNACRCRRRCRGARWSHAARRGFFVAARTRGFACRCMHQEKKRQVGHQESQQRKGAAPASQRLFEQRSAALRPSSAGRTDGLTQLARAGRSRADHNRRRASGGSQADLRQISGDSQADLKRPTRCQIAITLSHHHHASNGMTAHALLFLFALG